MVVKYQFENFNVIKKEISFLFEKHQAGILKTGSDNITELKNVSPGNLLLGCFVLSVIFLLPPCGQIERNWKILIM